jgi:hypothetical protein
MDRLIASDVAVAYSWLGAKKKKSFSKLSLANVIKSM